MRSFIIQVPDSDGARVDAYARARGITSEAAAADLLQISINENADIVARIRDVEQSLARRRAKAGNA